MDPSADPIADLSQVRWTTRYHTPDNWAADVEPMGGWHVVGEVGNDPDPHVRERFDLWVQNAHDGDGGDCSAWLADMVARKLTETVGKEREAQVRAVQDARWRVAAADRDAERRWDLSGALGWNLPKDPADERDEPPTWHEIVEGIKGLREMAVVPVGEQRVPCTCGYDRCTGTAMVSKVALAVTSRAHRVRTDLIAFERTQTNASDT